MTGESSVMPHAVLVPRRASASPSLLRRAGRGDGGAGTEKMPYSGDGVDFVGVLLVDYPNCGISNLTTSAIINI